MARGVNGLHHITAIAGPAQENVDFYAGILGMHLVKRSVNQDDPGTYHLFYADAEGSPGTDLTFFPWARTAPPRIGHGLAVETSLEIPAGSLEYWSARLERYGVRFETDGDTIRRPEPAGRRHARLSPVARRKRRGAGPAVHAVGRQFRAAGTADSRPLWCPPLGTQRRRHEPLPHRCARLRAPGRRGWMDAVRLRRTPPASSTSARRRTRSAAAGAWARCTI